MILYTYLMHFKTLKTQHIYRSFKFNRPTALCIHGVVIVIIFAEILELSSFNHYI